MSTTESRNDAITMTLTPPVDPTDPAWLNFVEIYPLTGPPFNQLFTLRSWLPDAYQVGNIAVTGNIITPDEITHAVTIWAVYSMQSVKASWADIAGRVGVGGLSYKGGIPEDVQDIIDYYREEHRGPKAALVSADDTQRVSKWLGWRSYP